MAVKGYVIKTTEEVAPPEEESRKLERLPFGVPKLDEGLEGGVPVGTWVLISGEPGTGKTVLTQHAVFSAISKGWKAIVVSTEMYRWEWLEQAKQLGLPVERCKDRIVRLKEMIVYNKEERKYQVELPESSVDIIFVDLPSLATMAKVLGTKEEKKKWYSYLDSYVLAEAIDVALRAYAKNPNDKYIKLESNVLLVIDSISVFYLRAPSMARKIALDLTLRFKRSDIIALLTAQYSVTTGATFGFGVEHVADGVIHMWMDNVEAVKEVRRYLIVKKMRMTQHEHRAYRVYIEKGKGMRVEPVE